MNRAHSTLITNILIYLLSFLVFKIYRYKVEFLYDFKTLLEKLKSFYDILLKEEVSFFKIMSRFLFYDHKMLIYLSLKRIALIQI